MSQVVTRIAPSPTGFMHIGTARTALFNWLYARGRDGKFYIRIEDTDRKRSTEEANKVIINGLNWLGLNYDGDIISQFERAPRHVEIAEALLKNKKAYKCYSSPEEIQNFKENAKKIYDEIILSNNKFYSVLSLNTIVEKNLETDKEKILNYFAHVENIVDSIEQKELIMFKKSLYLINISREKEGYKLLNDLISKNSKLKSIAEEIIKK